MIAFARWSSAVRVTLLVLSLAECSGCVPKEEQARNYYQHGLQLIAEHDSAKAAIELRNAVKLKADFTEAWKALAQIDEANKDWSRVIGDLRKVVELSADDASARLKLGKLLLLAGSTNEALLLMDVGLGRDDRNADFHAAKAAIALELGDRTGAFREAKIALEFEPMNADALIVLALDRLSRGDPNAALSILRSAADEKGLQENSGFQLLKIQLLGKTGDLIGAENTLKELIQQNPREPGYCKLLVNFYIEQRRIENAEREMRSCVAGSSSDPAAVLDLVRFLFAVKRAPAEARKELNARINAGGDTFQFQMALAEMDAEEGRSDEGEQLLLKLVGDTSTSGQKQIARIALGRLYLKDRNLDRADKLANDVLEDDSHNVSALSLLASVRLEHSQPSAAISSLTTALAYQPRSIELMSLLAIAYERSGLIELADKQFADATRVSGFDPRVGIEYADFLERRGGFARAEDVLVELLKRRPNNIQLLAALGQLRLARQNWGGAQEVAESTRRFGDSGLADRLLGEALIGQGKYTEAQTALEKAYKATSGSAALNSLISAFLKANKKDDASRFLKMLLRDKPDSAEALVLLGSLQLSGGEVEHATRSFLAAISAQPKQEIGYRALSDMYRHQNKYEEAIQILRQGIQEQPGSAALQMTLANAMEQKGDYEAAISQYDTILDKEPGNLVASNNLISLLLDHRTDDRSLKRAQSLAAILRKSQIPQFEDTLAWAKYHQGDFVTAISLGEEAILALSDKAEVRYHLGMAYIAAGRADKASEQLKKALELAPDDQLVKTIKSALERLSGQAPRSGRPS